MSTLWQDGLELCTDCVFLIANGEGTEEHAELLASRYPVGTLVLACEEDCEGWFSYSPCDGCGSTLGGDRHPGAVLS